MYKVGSLFSASSKICYSVISKPHARNFSNARILLNSTVIEPKSPKLIQTDKTRELKEELKEELKQETQEEVKEETKKAPKSPKNVDEASIHTIKEKNLLNNSIIQALQSLGFEKLTPVQIKTLEPALGENDIVTKAKTGTGKTLAFGIPMIEQILRKPKGHDGVRGLIIAPTRDLAFQIRDEIDKLAKHKSVVKSSYNQLNVKTFVGGESRWDQIRNFKNKRSPPPSIIVATPGRFLDVIKEPIVADAFTDLQTFVLDEADRLLGEGFREDLVEISDVLKELRERSNTTDLKPLKTMLFSATMDQSILDFSKRILRTEQKHIDTVDPNEPETHEKIAQSLILTENIFESYVSAALFIQNESKRVRNFKAIVFLPTVKSVSYFYETLAAYLNKNNAKLRNFQLHGQLRQPVRDRSVREFRNSFSGVLVASDVGARGMDFPNVTNVIQIGLPMDATNYVHRVGRTARGGKTGNAVMILTKGESRFTRILKQRNVIVTEKFQYERSPEAEEIFSQLSQETSHRNSLELVLESLCGFAKSVVSTYRLNLFEMLEDISKGYGRFVGDESKLPPISANFATRVLGLGRRDSSDLFSVEGSSGRDDYGERAPRRSYRDSDDDNDGRYVKRNNRNFGSSRNYARNYDDSSEGSYNQRKSYGNNRNGGHSQNRNNNRYNRNDRSSNNRSSKDRFRD